MSEFEQQIKDGIRCEDCGELIDGASVGHPRKCNSCSAATYSIEDAIRQERLDNKWRK
mgnify:CR=1 FL=1